MPPGSGLTGAVPPTREKSVSNLKKRFEAIDDLGHGRGPFERDYTAILYSHAFRRMRHKTQVFFYPQNDHVCTRLDHLLYVAAISEIVCKALRTEKSIDCDPMLARTIGIGHDLGHAPFGHAGEEVLDQIAKDIGGFKHEKHGLRIVDKIEKPRMDRPVVGLNLTLAVRDGIVNHNGESRSTSVCLGNSPCLDGDSLPCTLEGCIVRLVDKIAYLGRDLEDALIAVEAKMLKSFSVPAEINAIIGTRNGEIVNYFVGDIIESSTEQRIALSEAGGKLMGRLMTFNYEHIYRSKKVESYKKRVSDVLRTLFARFLNVLRQYEDHIDSYKSDDLRVVRILGKFIEDRGRLYFDEETSIFSGDKKKLYKRIVTDFMSTLTDSFVFQACSEYFLPRHII